MEIARVPGLSWHQRAETDVVARASWFEIPGADALNAALSQEVSRRVDAYKVSVTPSISHPGEPLTAITATPPADSPLAVTPRPARSQLNVTTTLTAVSPTVLGVRLTAFEANPLTSTLTFTSYYWDAPAGRVAAAADLFASDEARITFADQVRAGLKANGIAEPVITNEQALAAVAFRGDGTAVAELSQGVIPGLGSVAVPVSSTTVAPLLSDLGVRAQAAAVGGTFPEGAVLPEGSAPLDEGSGTTASNAAAPNCAVVTCVALTYDDGPVPDTNRLLDILKAKDVPATFFVVGQMARRHPEILQREIAEGHEVGNHSMGHPKLTQKSPDALAHEIVDDNAIIAQATGIQPTLARPPYGVYNASVNTVYAQQNQQNIIWDVDSRDWATKNADATVAMVDALAQPGSIVLMHDLHPTTIDAAGGVIDTLRAKGYTFVTVSQLLDGTNPQPGKVYSFRPGATVSQDRSAG